MMTTAIDHPHALPHITDDELVEVLHEVNHKFRRHYGELLTFIAEFHFRNLALQHGARNTAHWLTLTLDIAPKTAQEYVTVASRSFDFPRVRDALYDGLISYSAVRILAKYLTADNEEDLLELARELTCTDLAQALAGQEHTDGSAEPEGRFKATVRDDGWVSGSFLLNPADGANLLAAVKLGEIAFHRDVEGLTDLEHINDEFEDLVGDKSYSRFGPPPTNMMLSALRGMVNIVLSNPSSSVRSPAANVNVIVSTDGQAALAHQPGAQSSQLASLIENGAMRLLMTNEKGAILHYGRSRRLVSDSQANAILAAQNHTCAMPGCNHKRFMQFHHLHEWESGGATDVDNLLGLCSSCHMMVTFGLVKIVARGEDIHYIYPNDVVFTSHKRGLPARNFDPIDPTMMALNWARNFGERDTFDDELFDDPLITISFED
ncbi:HNH endonuclease [Corynebacterium cystitidis]|uniref:HNH endonuclease n=1 Tax=Corynebacterium cystitidis TaxID=35757 RepID=UPI00211EF07B|nr:HNH endonuclease signature motif containing protein [Corynebacterium cystitidis]